LGRLKTGVTKLKRLIIIDPLEDDEIIWRAERTGLSKSEVHRELRMLGYQGFDRKYGIGKFSPEKEEEKARAEDEDLKERRRKWREYLRDAEGRGEVSDAEDLARRLDESLKRYGFKKKGEGEL